MDQASFGPLSSSPSSNFLTFLTIPVFKTLPPLLFPTMLGANTEGFFIADDGPLEDSPVLALSKKEKKKH